MALLAMAGFDPKALLLEGYSTSGTIAYNTTTKRTGTASIETSQPTNTGAVTVSFNGTLDNTIYARVYLYIGTLGSGLNNLLSVAHSGTLITTCTVNGSGQIAMTAWNGVSMAPIAGSPSAVGTLAAGQWYRIELAITITSSGADSVSLLVNGVSKLADNTLTVGNTATWEPNQIKFGNPAASAVLYWDDFQVNDSTGASNNTWPGDGQILCLFPTSDVNRGTWTAGGGATTNLYQALDNAPPVGVAHNLATDASQIKVFSPGSTAVFGFPTYASQGIGPSNTVNAIRSCAAAGRSSSGPTVGTEVTSNPTGPAISQVGVSTEGTYPTGWNQITGSMNESPTIDRYTAIQASIASTVPSNAAGACAMVLQISVSGTLIAPGVRQTKSLSDSVTLSDSPSSVLTAGRLLEVEGWAWDWGLGRGFR